MATINVYGFDTGIAKEEFDSLFVHQLASASSTKFSFKVGLSVASKIRLAWHPAASASTASLLPILLLSAR